MKEYLPQLQQRTSRIKETENLKTGDVVLVIDQNTPRNEWLLGRVIRPISSKDGLVRSVEIKTKDTTLIRPITKICLVERVDIDTRIKEQLREPPVEE